MLIETGITIAYKCSSCGTFEFFNISLFELSCKKVNYLTCHCNKSSISITEENSRDYKIMIPCMACGNTHIYNLSRKEMFYKDINVFNCPETGIRQCFIGNDKTVRKQIDSLEKELDELIDMFGYDSYFKNTQVMFDALNKVHDIAEQKSLYCECGNDDIELTLFPDRIHLRCKKCPGNRTIYAESNEDLKDLLMRHQILLLQDFAVYDARKTSSFMRQTDGK